MVHEFNITHARSKLICFLLHYMIVFSQQTLISHILLSIELERISASPSGAVPRHVSDGQMKFLEALVKKHGGNVKAMAADLKLNPEQRTIGQIRRALKGAGLLNYQLDFE